MSDFILSISESRFWFAPIFGEISSNFVSSKSVVAVAVSMSVCSLKFFYFYVKTGVLSSTHLFHTSATPFQFNKKASVQHKCVSSTQMRQFPFVRNWRFCVKLGHFGDWKDVTLVCWTDGCVELRGIFLMIFNPFWNLLEVVLFVSILSEGNRRFNFLHFSLKWG